MSGNVDAEPLDLRALFSVAWEGEAEVWRPRWIRWIPAPSAFRFRSEIANLEGDVWEVIDTSTFPNGAVERRRMHARQTSPRSIRLEADDMPGGATVRLRSDGFDLDPFVLRTKILGSLRLPIRYRDQVLLTDGGDTLVDSLELRVLGFVIARVTMRLKRRGKSEA